MGVISELWKDTRNYSTKFLLLLGVVASAPVGAETLKVCYENQDYLPFIHAPLNDSVSEQSKLGVLPELIQMAARHQGLKVHFSHSPWKRCIEQLKRNQVDAIFAAIWLPERDVWGYFPKHLGKPNDRLALWRVNYHVYSNIYSNLSWNGHKFSNMNLGVSAPIGYVAYKQLRRMSALPAMSLLPKEGLELVALNRLDGYVVEQNIGDHLVKSLKIESKVKTLPIPFIQSSWFMPVSKQWYLKNPERAQNLWESLAKFRKEHGDRLYKKYR